MFEDLYRSIDRERRRIAEDLERSRRERREEAAAFWVIVSLLFGMAMLLFCSLGA